MRIATIQAVRQQYGFCCGYCGISETDAGATLTIDHYHPRSRGGSDDFSNLVYCCHACNEHKGDYWNPGGIERILHPFQDDLALHYTEQSDFLFTAITDTGRFHITRLQLNRPALIAYRDRKNAQQVERHERGETLSILSEILKQITDVKERIKRLQSGGE